MAVDVTMVETREWLERQPLCSDCDPISQGSAPAVTTVAEWLGDVGVTALTLAPMTVLEVVLQQ